MARIMTMVMTAGNWSLRTRDISDVKSGSEHFGPGSEVSVSCTAISRHV